MDLQHLLTHYYILDFDSNYMIDKNGNI